MKAFLLQNIRKVALTKSFPPHIELAMAVTARRIVGVLSCAELIMEDERLWQFISSHTEALLTMESKDRRIHLFNFCFGKQASNDTVENEDGRRGNLRRKVVPLFLALRFLHFLPDDFMKIESGKIQCTKCQPGPFSLLVLLETLLI